MGCKLGCSVAGADVQGHDWGFEIAMDVRRLREPQLIEIRVSLEILTRRT